LPKFLENKLKKKYGPKSAVPFKIMNSIGAMRGNKETKKGAEMEKKHEMKSAAPIKGLSSKESKMKGMKKKKKEAGYDPFARALNK
jgi:hypothetical protein